MKYGVITMILSLLAFYTDAQQSAGYNEKRSFLPKDSTYTIASLSRFFNEKYPGKADRLEAAYNWVTANISYSKDSAYYFNNDPDASVKVSAALRRRKGVCENYAAIFNELANACGVRSVLVSGYTRQAGSIDRSGHAWCALYVKNEWRLADPTWDEGRQVPHFFLADPGEFIFSHMPFDPLWQLLPYPVSNKEFMDGSHSDQNKSYWNVNDSINAYLAMNPLDQLQATEQRIRNANAVNQLLKNELARTRMDMEIIREDHDMDLYNEAVQDLNKATRLFNQFIQYRNNQFVPPHPEAEVRQMLTPAVLLVEEGKKKLLLIKSSKAALELDHSLLELHLASLSTKLDEQLQYITHYFSSTAGH